MITSIFSKSKPINFIIVFFIIGLACAVAYFKIENNAINIGNALNVGGLFVVSYFSMLVLNFISSKNNLTRTNNFEILLYGLFLLLIPYATLNLSVILSNIFLLFSLRRIISLRSQKNVKKKLFDAAFWITVASLFYVWTILFFILMPIAVRLYTDNKIRNWIIPFAGSLSVLLIAYSVCVIIDFDLMAYVWNGFQLSFDFSSYNTVSFLVGLTLLLSFGVWSLFFYIKSINEKKKALRPALYIIMLVVIISFLVIVIVPQKTGSEFLFMFAPLAIIITNYIEIIKERWFKEVFLATLIIVPFILLLL
ncbi:DUF6427 family protein [Algibacter sp. 2305UL17-15]|uniref:DUF6427 family protein n=1 Tax=Algibacter sp. 2305UL17-15 TaxID=3231268 RepID=UPI003458A27C